MGRDHPGPVQGRGVAFFFKQWGGLRPKTGGRKLDGQEWNQFPSRPLQIRSRHNNPWAMVALQDYAGREQSYVKHVFLERYLEALIFKTASRTTTSFTSMASPDLGRVQASSSRTRRSVSP